jgi:hypothetical protein
LCQRAELLDVDAEDPAGFVLELEIDELGTVGTHDGIDDGAKPLSIDERCAPRGFVHVFEVLPVNVSGGRQKNSEPQDWGPQCDSHQLGRGP